MTLRRLVLAPLVALIRIQQKTLRHLYFWPRCRYTPSCSEYMIEALEKRGLILGLVLGSWRILRCNPWFGGSGHDPVPERRRSKTRGKGSG